MVTNCNQLKMISPKDGKSYKTDVVHTRDMLRIIQSIPSPKAEPFKLWLAQVGSEILDETNPYFDRPNLMYIYANGYKERLKLDKHLQIQ